MGCIQQMHAYGEIVAILTLRVAEDINDSDVMAVVSDPDCALGETPHVYIGDLQTRNGSVTAACLGRMLEETANIGGR
jgi:hypothetical protein